MPWRLSPFIWVNWRPTDLLLTPSCVFSISFIACVCSEWFFLIFSLCWCSHWFLHCSLKFTEHQIWPSLSTLYQISTYLHFIEVFPWSFIVLSLAQILLSFNFDWLSVCLYELGNTVAFPSLEGMALCRCILVWTAHAQWFWREDWSWSLTWVRTSGAHEGLPPWRKSSSKNQVWNSGHARVLMAGWLECQFLFHLLPLSWDSEQVSLYISP